MKEKKLLLWELFHENTKLYPHLVPHLMPEERELYDFMLENKKDYPWVKKIPLNTEKKLKATLGDVLIKRRSTRNFSRGKICFEDISALLKFSYGVSGAISLNGKLYNLYTSPSAGALYSCVIYIVAINVKELKQGVYYYNPDSYSLEVIKTEMAVEKQFKNCLTQPEMFPNFASAIIIVADMEKIFYKYGERGYRYVLLDAGHIGENVYLVATALNLGVVGVEGFYDERISDLLELKKREVPLYVLLVGKKEDKL